MSDTALDNGAACGTSSSGEEVLTETVSSLDAVRARFCEDVFVRAYSSETALRRLGERAARAAGEAARDALTSPFWGGTVLVVHDGDMNARGLRRGTCEGT